MSVREFPVLAGRKRTAISYRYERGETGERFEWEVEGGIREWICGWGR